MKEGTREQKFQKIKKGLEYIHSTNKIDYLKTLILNFKYTEGENRCIYNVIVYDGFYYEISKTGKIILNKGNLELGKSWTRKSVFPSVLKLGNNSKLIINGHFKIYEGASIYINDNACLILGSGHANNRFNLSCFDRIIIGDHVVISEGVTLRDSDNHTIKYSEPIQTIPIEIGNHIWIGMNTTILKGVKIGNGSVIAAGAVVNKNVPENSLVGGIPAKVIKENICWE